MSKDKEITDVFYKLDNHNPSRIEPIIEADKFFRSLDKQPQTTTPKEGKSKATDKNQEKS